MADPNAAEPAILTRDPGESVGEVHPGDISILS